MPTAYPTLGSSPWNTTLKAYIDSLVAESVGGPWAPLVHTHPSTDITDFETAVLDIIGGGVGGVVPYYYPEDFGAVGDGIADDGDAIRAATDAAGDAGGGIVFFSKQYAWTGDIGPYRDGVIYRGPGGGDATLGLKALDNTSRVRVGNWTGGEERPGGMFDLVIDGNNTGLATGLVHQQSVWTTMIGVKIMNAAGVGWLIDGAQNSSYISVDTTGNGTNVRVTNGAGGLMFMRCSNAPKTGGKGLVIDDSDGSTGNVYPFGSAHIQWTECIFEQHVTGVTDLVRIDCGGLLRFTSCGFSDNNVASGAAELVRVSNDSFPAVTTSVEFESCNFNGGNVNQRPSIRMLGSSRVIITGDTYWQQTSAFLLADASAPTVSILGSFLAGSGVGSLMSTVNGGTLTNVLNRRYIFDDYRLSATQATVIAARRDTDVAGLRYFLNRDGTHSWSDGTGFSAKQSLGYNAASDVISCSSMLVTGRRLSNITQQSISTAGQSVTLDSRINTHEVYLTGSGTVTTMTVSNPVQGAEIELWVTQDGTGGHSYVWPADFDWGIGGSAPTDTTPNKSVVIKARYRTGLNKWFVFSTNVVPAAGGGGTVTSVNGDPGPAVVLDAADVGAQPADSDLSDIAGLAASNDDFIQRKSGAWTNRTIAQVKSDLGITGAARIFEVTTATAAATAAKTATIGGGYAYTDGDLISVIATSGNLAASPTLNIDGLGAKSILLGGSAATLYSAVLAANGRWFLRYDLATDRFDLYGVSGNWDIASQANMEAGTSTTVGWMNPLLVAQAIAALAHIGAPNTQTGAYTLVLTDRGKRIRYNSASAANITIPPNSSVAFPVGTHIEVAQVGAGQATIIPGAGVTINNASSNITRTQNSVLVLYKDATDTWTVSGDMQ